LKPRAATPTKQSLSCCAPSRGRACDGTQRCARSWRTYPVQPPCGQVFTRVPCEKWYKRGHLRACNIATSHTSHENASTRVVWLTAKGTCFGLKQTTARPAPAPAPARSSTEARPWRHLAHVGHGFCQTRPRAHYGRAGLSEWARAFLAAVTRGGRLLLTSKTSQARTSSGWAHSYSLA
jgi:hypothetical protein